MTMLRGELRCFSCSRYLGDFESHNGSRPRDLHLCRPDSGALPQFAVLTERGLRCSHCGGRAVAENVDRVGGGRTRTGTYRCTGDAGPPMAA